MGCGASTPQASKPGYEPLPAAPPAVAAPQEKTGIKPPEKPPPEKPPVIVNDGQLPLPAPYELVAVRAHLAKRYGQTRTPVLITGTPAFEEGQENLQALVHGIRAPNHGPTAMGLGTHGRWSGTTAKGAPDRGLGLGSTARAPQHPA